MLLRVKPSCSGARHCKTSHMTARTVRTQAPLARPLPPPRSAVTTMFTRDLCSGSGFVVGSERAQAGSPDALTTRF